MTKECVNKRTPWLITNLTLGDQDIENLLHPSQIGDFCLDIFTMLNRHALDLGTGYAARISKPQQVTDLIQCKAEFAGPADKCNPRDIAIVIDPPTAFAASSSR
ncbi:hypothetical protein Aam_003_005 [Acidocella aminolytica 101 = DSM 11237]|uniref:Uncharacterized protein n=1 Tax=Acidocella aminolytica 101 = DSM 11237 TaxID=1120923 RepID=A0A0D6PBK1_9PROT|nr:hypothetical protein Aam_003_005 [Acidocella aminolytica 101 = DSM 11237]GBQ34146.1 hypothetical protein AA11237_0671 [Acidocella aminolytica 101 = DSM 11237]